MANHTRTIPNPTPTVSLGALGAMIQERSVMAGMRVFHEGTGDIFKINLPGFKPVVMVGPEACHFMLVESRHDLRWRMENEPITNLLIHGVLVEDNESHDDIRRKLNPALHKKMLGGYVDSIVSRTDQISTEWQQEAQYDMLVEVRKIALLILMDTLFEFDYTSEIDKLWDSVLYLIKYISPGFWLIWKGAPHPGYKQARKQMDNYFHEIIRIRREQIAQESEQHRTDMLSGLIYSGMDNNLIRDQLMTMLIAGHDTSTALLAWALYLISNHPDTQAQIHTELDEVLGTDKPTPENIQELTFLTQVINETLRLYPPIHLGSRTANADLEFQGYEIPEGTRVLYSIYLTQRHPDYWQEPNAFKPERFAPGNKIEPYTFLPFGGGPRNCIGAAFAQVESKVVLARLLQQFRFNAVKSSVHEHMGATLEPRPGVKVTLTKRG